MLPVVPVILCGGVGARLWPLSSAAVPKPFHSLAGERTLFQQALLRAGSAVFTAPPMVVAQSRHGALARAQAAELGVEIRLLLEAAPHGTLPAALLGALAAEAQYGHAVIAILAADHYIPDPAGFAACVAAAVPPAKSGALVVLGIAPRAATPDYGYILPHGPDEVTAVRCFVEKPAAAVAARLISDGALWNSGNFIVSVQTLLTASQQLAPHILAAVREGCAQRQSDGDDLRVTVQLPPDAETSLDRALAERFHDVRVVRAGFAWSDVGTWDEVSAVCGTGGVFVHSTGVPVKVVGFDDLAGDMLVIVTGDGVLVTRKGQSGALKRAVSPAAD